LIEGLKVHRRWPSLAGRVIAGLIVLGPAGSGAVDGIQFLDPLTNEPLALDRRPAQEITPAVERFHATGINPYAGDPQAVAAGKQIYARWCQACHMPDGSGRIGPNLNDSRWQYPRTATDHGRFEIIYAGGAGAMQAFGDRLDQDEILKLMAFVDTLQKP
jgi:cytochrome c-L